MSHTDVAVISDANITVYIITRCLQTLSLPAQVLLQLHFESRVRIISQSEYFINPWGDYAREMGLKGETAADFGRAAIAVACLMYYSTTMC